MDLSEPGTVPDPGMLASLIDLVRTLVYCVLCTFLLHVHVHVHVLSDRHRRDEMKTGNYGIVVKRYHLPVYRKSAATNLINIYMYLYIVHEKFFFHQSDGPVVARAMVLLECAFFVHNLRDKDNKSVTRWLCNKKVSHQRDVQAVAVNLKKWAVAIGEKLRIVELRERDMLQRLQRKGGGKNRLIVLPEEPVLHCTPEQEKQKSGEGSGKFWTVSFGIKMCACVLLYEITHYLRDNAYTTPSVLGTPHVSITDLADRRQSIVSSTSTDTEAVATPSPGVTGVLGHSLDSRSALLKRPLSQVPYSSSLEEDATHGIQSSSLDDEEFVEQELHKEPQRKVSVYLRVNSAVDNAEGRGRVNTALKQTVNVKSSPDASKLAPKRRSSVSASVGQRHISFYKKKDDRPVVKGRTSAITVGVLRPTRKVKASSSFQDNVDSSPSELLTRPTLQPQSSTTSQKSHNLGEQIQNGISRLATRARAFRRKIGRKTAGPRKTSLSGSSPNLTQRKRLRKLSQSLVLGIEDDKRYFPWLDIVEHLVIVDALNPDAHASHARACTELVTALNHVYALQEGGNESQETRSHLNSMFSGAFMNRDGPKTSVEQSRGGQPRRTAKVKPLHGTSVAFSPSATFSISSSQSSHQSLASLDFSQIRRSVFSSPSLNQGIVIELFLEQDSPLPETRTNTKFNRARKHYIRQSYAGLVHTPFSLLVYTAPILLSSSFRSLKEVAWEMILDRNQELAQAAGG